MSIIHNLSLTWPDSAEYFFAPFMILGGRVRRCWRKSPPTATSSPGLAARALFAVLPCKDPGPAHGVPLSGTWAIVVTAQMATHFHMQIGWLKPECVLAASTDLPLYYVFSMAKLGAVSSR